MIPEEVEALRHPDYVAYWTKQIRGAQTRLQEAERPCQYGPWHKALLFESVISPRVAGQGARLSSFLEIVSAPGWPDGRRELIDFALLVLKADVMLFRSGYAKRHLIRRLQHSALTDNDVADLRDLIVKAIQRGVSREEFGAYRKLAAALVIAGRLPGFEDWLETQAEGAIITMDAGWHVLFSPTEGNANLTEADHLRLFKSAIGGMSYLYDFGLSYPKMDQLVQAGSRTQSHAQFVKRNAWQMLISIKRRRRSQPRSD